MVKPLLNGEKFPDYCALPCNTCMVIVAIWVTNAPITLLPLALMGLSLDDMSPRVGFGPLSTLMDVSMGAAISVKHLNDFSTIGQTLILCIKTEFSIGNFQSVLCVQCVPYMCSCHESHMLSAFCICFRWFSLLSTSDGPNFFIRVYRIEY